MPTFTNAGGNNNGVVGTTASHDANGVVGHNSDSTARNASKPSGHGVSAAHKYQTPPAYLASMPDPASVRAV